MFQKRRKAFPSAGLIAVGVFLVGWGSFLPAIKIESSVGFSGFHLSLKPTGSVDQNPGQQIMLSVGFVILIGAFLLALTRRRGWGLAWRAGVLFFLLFLAAIVVDLWGLVSDPSHIPDDDFVNADATSTVLAIVAKAPIHLVSASPGPGLWLISFGCLAILVGAFLPSLKSNQIVVRDDDPRFPIVVSALQQYVPQRYSREDRSSWTPPYGGASYYRT